MGFELGVFIRLLSSATYRLDLEPMPAPSIPNRLRYPTRNAPVMRIHSGPSRLVPIEIGDKFIKTNAPANAAAFKMTRSRVDSQRVA